jgi:hypothetical protein
MVKRDNQQAEMTVDEARDAYREAHDQLIWLRKRMDAFIASLEKNPIKAFDYEEICQHATLFEEMGRLSERLNEITMHLQAVLVSQIHIKELYAATMKNFTVYQSFKATMELHEVRLEKYREILQLHRQDCEIYFKVLNGIQYRSPITF